MIGCAAWSADRPTRATRGAAVDLHRSPRPGGHARGHDARPAAAGARHGVGRIDAVLFTHSHADHIWGSTRSGGSTTAGRRRSRATRTRGVGELRARFYYAFDGPRLGGGIPQVDVHEIDGPFAVGGVRVVPVPLFHGTMPILGFRFGGFAYLTDCSRIPDDSWPLLRRRRDARHRRASGPAALDAFHGGGGARGDRARSPPARLPHAHVRTTWDTRRPTRACPRALNWHMMGWCSTSASTS